MPAVAEIIYPPDESYLTNYDLHYPIFLGLNTFTETITIVKNETSYDNLKNEINISFPSDSEIRSAVTNSRISHSINISRGSKIFSSAFDYPSSSVYYLTLAQVEKKAEKKANTKDVTIKPKPLPADYYATYGSFLVYNENPNYVGRELITDESGKIRYDEDDDGNVILELQDNGQMKKVQMVRWFPHTSPEGGNDTIGFGHKLTNQEVSSQTITINGKSYNYTVRGLRTTEVKDLFINDISSKTQEVQSFIGTERVNWLIDNHPSWLCILIDCQYNTKGVGVKDFPKLLYWMGMYTSPKPPEDGGNITEWNQWANKMKNMKTLTGIPFKPVIKEGTDYDEQLRLIAQESSRSYRNGQGELVPLTKRNSSTTQTFIYHYGTHYDNILSNGGKPLTDY